MKTTKEILNNLVTKNKTMMLATASENLAHSSYSCFVYDKKKQHFYILVASISRHTKNIINNKILSGMLIEDEISTKIIWFRKRIHYDLKAKIIKDKNHYSINLLADKFGSSIKQFLKINFIIIELEIIKGLMNIGPGEVYKINHKNEIFEQIKSNKE